MAQIELAHANGSTVYEPHQYERAELLNPDEHPNMHGDAIRVWAVDPDSVESPTEGQEYQDYEYASIVSVDPRVTAEQTDPEIDIEWLDEDTASEIKEVLNEVRVRCGIDSAITTQCDYAIEELESDQPVVSQVTRSINSAEAIAIKGLRHNQSVVDLLKLATQFIDVRTSDEDDNVNYNFTVPLDNIPDRVAPPELTES